MSQLSKTMVGEAIVAPAGYRRSSVAGESRTGARDASRRATEKRPSCTLEAFT